MQFLILIIFSLVFAGSLAAQRPPRGDRNHHLEWFNRADTNKNGTVERDEFDEDADAMFKDSDRNGDGVIDETEIPRPSREPKPMGEGFRTAPKPPGMPPFAMEDANRDGKLTRAEFDANMNRHFRMEDENNDGVISRDEISEKPEKPFRRMPPPNVEFLGAEMRFGDNLVKNAPFSAETVMENTRRLFDGSIVKTQNKGAIYRDGAGRTRREQMLETVGGFSLGNQAQKLIFITDVGEGTQYFLDANRKTARRIPLMDNRLPQPTAETVEGKNESLGTKVLEGVSVEGTRSVIEIPAGKLGNDKALQVITERWYSSELQTIVMTRHVDPLSGEQIFRLTNIKRIEPPRELFVVPTDYRVETDRRIEDKRQ